MKKILSLVALLLSLMTMQAALPIVKVDINEASRKDSETNEPGYTPWKFGKDKVADSITVEGVEMLLRGRMVTRIDGQVYVDEECYCRSSWNKSLVQGPNYHRLQGDGLVLEPTTMMGAIELVFKNLPVGTHHLQTYHNSWDAASKKEFYPFDVYVNGVLVYDSLMRTVQAASPSECLIVKTSFNVEKEGQQVVIRFETNPNYSSTTSLTKECTPVLNAFELNTVSIEAKAAKPVPADADYHVDADLGYFNLQWTAAENAVKHHVYLGTSKDALSLVSTQNAGDTSWVANSLKTINTYYWRVDEEDANGVVSEGDVWSFRPRHLAFPGAEGYGRFAHGGRGGDVVYVTNLDASGPGSFHEAVTTSNGPRTVLFAVSGRIQLGGRLVMNPYITIAGQTAPGKGICISRAPLGSNNDCISRFIRVRLGGGQTADGFGMAGNDHSIIDHTSISWAIDEVFSSRNAKNITLQRSMVTEALNVAGHKNYGEGKAHGFAGTVSGDIGSIHHNLLAHNNGRNWSLGGGLDGSGYYAGRMDISNNVVYNWDGRTTDGGVHQANFVNNYYKRGPVGGNTTIFTAQIENIGQGSQSYYYAGNILQDSNNGALLCDGSDPTCARDEQLGKELTWQLWVDEPFFPSYIHLESAQDAYKSTMSDVGCTMPIFDEQDQRVVRETMDATFTYRGSYTGLPGLIDNEADAGGFEDYGHEVIDLDAFDTDRDGLPNWWESMMGTNPESASGDFSDSNADPDGDGYTNLEDYLDWMSVPRYYLSKNQKELIDLKPYFRAYTNAPVFTVESLEEVTAAVEDSQLSLQLKKNFEGVRYVQVKVIDADNSTYTRRIGICMENELDNVSQNYISSQAFSVYPSKFSSSMTLLYHGEEDVQVYLYDMNGKEIMRSSFNGGNELVLNDLDKLPSQMYYLMLRQAQTQQILGVQKVVKQ